MLVIGNYLKTFWKRIVIAQREWQLRAKEWDGWEWVRKLFRSNDILCERKTFVERENTPSLYKWQHIIPINLIFFCFHFCRFFLCSLLLFFLIIKILMVRYCCCCCYYFNMISRTPLDTHTMCNIMIHDVNPKSMNWILRTYVHIRKSIPKIYTKRKCEKNWRHYQRHYTFIIIHLYTYMSYFCFIIDFLFLFSLRVEIWVDWRLIITRDCLFLSLVLYFNGDIF